MRKKKTTNKEKELRGLSELKSVAEKRNSGFVPQVTCGSKFVDNEFGSRYISVEISLNLEMSNNHEQNNTLSNNSSMEVFAEGERKKILWRIIKMEGEKFKSSKNSILIENRMLRL